MCGGREARISKRKTAEAVRVSQAFAYTQLKQGVNEMGLKVRVFRCALADLCRFNSTNEGNLGPFQSAILMRVEAA